MVWENIKAFFLYYFGYMDERDFLLRENTYKGYRWYPMCTRRSIDELETFEADENDVFLITYPKSGTHWIGEIVRLVMADGHPEEVDRTLDEFPIETIHADSYWDLVCNNTTKTGCSFVKRAPSPRIIGSHMSLKFVPPSVWKNNAKLIYAARNFKDMLVSLYNFQSKVNFKGKALVTDFPTLLHEALEGKVQYNGWWEHVQEYWDAKDRENVLFVTYEEMQKDLRNVIFKISNFLDISLSDEALERVVANAEIKTMKANQDKAGLSVARQLLKTIGAGDFMNKGVSGRWKKYFTVEQNEEVDLILEERMKGYEELVQRLTY